MILRLGLLIGLLYSGVAHGACDCFCVEGRWQTLCTGVEDAADRPNLCLDRAAGSCPAPTGDFEPATYTAPIDGAENCRDVRIWDPRAGEYLGGRVCDVAQDSSR